MNRTFQVKDTFLSVFPNYGVTEDLLRKQMRFSPYMQHEGIDKRYHYKMDQIKNYTENLLRVKNMQRK